MTKAGNDKCIPSPPALRPRATRFARSASSRDDRRVSGTIVRFGVIGDIHCEDALLAAALDHLSRQRLDHILAVGDLADGRGDLDRCCELLERHGVTVVAGNHDRWLLADQMRDLSDASAPAEVSERSRSYLAKLPPTVRFETVAGALLLCHGLDENDMAKVGPDDDGYAIESNFALQRLMQSEYSFVLCGHTHRRMVRRFGALTVINAGTLHFAHTPGFGVVDLDARFVQFHELAPDGSITEAKRLLLP